MITLKSGHYTNEDYEYLLRVASCAHHYCIEIWGVSEERCKKCNHSLACKDLQDLSAYCQKKLISNTD